MRPSRTAALSLGAAAAMLLLGLAGAHGADAPTAQAPTVGVAGVPPAPNVRPTTGTATDPVQRPLSPMMQDIQTLLDQERTAIDALRERIEQTLDAAELITLQLQVEQAKRQTQWSILEVQIHYAQAEGRTADAQQLQQALAASKRPPTPVTSLPPQAEAPPTADASPVQK